MSKFHALIVLVVIVSVYTVAILIVNPEQSWAWSHTLVASTASFLFAVLCGMYLFYWQRDLENENKRADHCVVLGAELGDIRRILSDEDRLQISLNSKQPIRVLITYVQPLAMERAALSGLFSNFETENLLHVARKIRMLNLKIDHALATLSSPNPELLLEHASKNIEETRAAILDAIAFLERKMDLSLSVHEE